MYKSGAVSGCEFEPCQEINVFAEIAAVVKPGGCCWQLSDADMVRSLFHDRAALVLRKIPPCPRLANGNQGSACCVRPAKIFLNCGQRLKFGFTRVTDIASESAD
jgi:hypothetical protein